jgi:photosystem II stability/assembly factor-like uncharacterized protein
MLRVASSCALKATFVLLPIFLILSSILYKIDGTRLKVGGTAMLKSRILSYAFLLFLSFIALIPLAGCGGGGAGGGGGSTGSGRDGTEQGKLSTPVINPQSGSFKKAQNVTITCSNNGAAIYYTTDGSDPTTSSKLYSTPIAILQSATIKAKASASGHSDSDIASASLTFQQNNTFSNSMEIVPTTYQSIAYTGTAWYGIPLQAGDFLHVTVIFSQGTPSLALYDSSQAPVSAATSANGTSCDLTYSVTASGNYYFTVSQAGKASRDTVTYTMTVSTNVAGQCAAPIFAPGDGSYDFPLTVTITSGTEGALIYYTIDGTPPTTSSTLYSGSVTLSAPGTLKAIAVKSGLTDSHVSSAVYELYIHPSPSPSPSPTPTQGGGGGGGGGGSFCVIQGTVSNTAGQGIEGAQVSLNYELKGLKKGVKAEKAFSTVSTTTTDKDGKYSFTNVTPREYTVSASHPDYLPNSETVTAQQNQVVTRDITLYWKLAKDFHGSWLWNVWGTDASNVVACGMNGTIARYNGTSWSYQYTGTTESLWDIWGTEDGTFMIAVGPSGYNLVSTDNGLTWTKRTMSIVNNSFYSVYGASDGSNLVAVTLHGIVYTSADKGVTWIQKADLNISVESTAVVWGSKDGSIFFIGTDKGFIFRSEDSGATWTQIAEFPKHQNIDTIWGTDSGFIVAGGIRQSVGGICGALFYSEDWGLTWQISPYIDSGINDFDVLSICGNSADGSKIILSGVNYKNTNNSIITTTQQKLINSNPLTEITTNCEMLGRSWSDPTGTNIFVTSTVGRVFLSTDGGTTWPATPSLSGELGDVYSIYGYDDSEVYAAGELGIAKLSSGNWSRVSTTVVPASSKPRGLWGPVSGFVFSCGTFETGPASVGNSANYLNTYDAFVNSGDVFMPIGYLDGAVDYSKFGLYDTCGYSDLTLLGTKLFSVGTYTGATPNEGLFVIYSYDTYWSMPYYPGFPQWDYYFNSSEYSLTWYTTISATTSLNGIWSTPLNKGTLISVGNGGLIAKMKWGSTNTDWYWEDRSNPLYAKSLRKVWGTLKPDNTAKTIYIAGDQVVLKSSDAGETWTLVDGLPYSASSDLYTALWAETDDEVYVGGRNIYRYDGTSWSKMFTTTDTSGATEVFSCFSLWGAPGGTKVYAGGGGGRIYSYDRPKSTLLKAKELVNPLDPVFNRFLKDRSIKELKSIKPVNIPQIPLNKSGVYKK